MSENPDKCVLKDVEVPLQIPSLSDITERLESLIEWESFGIHLLPKESQHCIQRIKKDNEGVNERKIALYLEWLKVDPSASWEKLITALRKAGEHTLALSVINAGK